MRWHKALLSVITYACLFSCGSGKDKTKIEYVEVPTSSQPTVVTLIDPAPLPEQAPQGVGSASLPLIYQSSELEATREVFADFGDLTIDPAQIYDDAAAATAAAPTIYKVDDGVLPWAAYWYPKRGEDLFVGDQSPLQKLDQYFQPISVASSSAQWELDHYDAKAAEWEGLCDAWAFASVLTKEPKAEVTINNVTFAPSDLKALAIKYFEGYAPKIYGRRYQGSAGTDGQIQDLRPEAFHRLVQEVIGKQHKPLIIDEDPGPEIWSKPLFRMSFKFTRDPAIPNAVLVDAFPWMIRQRAAVSNEATSIQKDLAAPLYQYRLYMDPKPLADGSMKVIAGAWIGSSINFHPDMVFLPGAARNAQQINPELRKNNEDIRKLLVTAGLLTDSL